MGQIKIEPVCNIIKVQAQTRPCITDIKNNSSIIFKVKEEYTPNRCESPPKKKKNYNNNKKEEREKGRTPTPIMCTIFV